MSARQEAERETESCQGYYDPKAQPLMTYFFQLIQSPEVSPAPQNSTASCWAKCSTHEPVGSISHPNPDSYL